MTGVGLVVALTPFLFFSLPTQIALSGGTTSGFCVTLCHIPIRTLRILKEDEWSFGLHRLVDPMTANRLEQALKITEGRFFNSWNQRIVLYIHSLPLKSNSRLTKNGKNVNICKYIINMFPLFNGCADVAFTRLKSSASVLQCLSDILPADEVVLTAGQFASRGFWNWSFGCW